ncbi:MAG: DUF2093 domain-containing protein [Asticcacaulis sp.]
MNKFDPTTGGQAVLQYSDADYTVMRPGSFVLCAVSGKPIPLEVLRYWNPVQQEAYASPKEALIRWKQLNGRS